MTETTHTRIADFPSNGFVDGVYSLVNPQVGTTRSGKTYFKCLLRDASGQIAARQWTFDEAAFADVRATGFVRVAGHTQLYNGQMQLVLEDLEATEITDEQLMSLLPTTTKDIDAMFVRVTEILGTLEHPGMKALADAYLADEQLMADFRRAPAATNLHHAWIGGLLEHTLQLLELACVMLPSYPKLNRDLVVMGLFLHDLAKTTELSWERGFEYTTDGNLIGHIVRGAIFLQVKSALAARSGQRLPHDAIRALQHIILSHHGRPEYGAARTPSTPEAIFVSQLDDLDAKTTIAVTNARPDGGPAATEFTEKIWSLETRLYAPDPLKTPE